MMRVAGQRAAQALTWVGHGRKPRVPLVERRQQHVVRMRTKGIVDLSLEARQAVRGLRGKADRNGREPVLGHDKHRVVPQR
jgi:hypothetical protein